MRNNRNRALLVTLISLAALLFLAGEIPAQKAPPSHSAKLKLMVPDNPSPHPPPVQPLPYSHKQHLAFGLECKNCHANPEPGKLMTFPPTAKCMECHVTIAKDKPAILKLAEYSKSNQPIPWVRVYTVLPGVAWDHRAHLDARVKCESCHGQVAQMDAISEVTSVTTMYSCLSCHEMNRAKTSCDTCHKH